MSELAIDGPINILVVLGLTLATVCLGTLAQWKRLESSRAELDRLESATAPLRLAGGRH